ncbi:MAG: DNA-3-methyladenine glycosylase [Deltaproteobacteria bacterium]|jgi:DNA-3-methyladenine glycosylase II|nr:DNA-3-methyladenine glycosylase [Deltaproteobacteria bacterium]
MKKPLDQFLIRKALRHLESSDRALSGLITKHGPCTITPALDNPFHALASSIISQQISAHAARAIKGRLFDLIGPQTFTPQNVLRISAKNSKAAGLSRPKFEYIRGLALAVRNGDLDFASIAKWEDEEVITKLITFSGIGRWTAEMFLIFGLGRPDVLSVNDAGLKRGFKVAYNLQQGPSADEMISISEPWRPYRSVGSWYLWRVVD